MHECKTHSEWLNNVHYMCSCGHVEWVHIGKRENKINCTHCNCTKYNGEVRPLTDHEILVQEQIEPKDINKQDK